MNWFGQWSSNSLSTVTLVKMIIGIDNHHDNNDILNKMIMIIRMFVIYHLLSELLGAPACPRFCLQLMVLNFFITIETE